MKKFRLKTYFVFLWFVLFFIQNCSQKKDPVTGQVETTNPNVLERAKEYSEKNPITIFGNNPLWRATLKSLDFIPLASVDYSGGLIVTDWYSEKTSDEEIKISIQFLSNELKSDSISIVSHKRICDQKGKCNTNLMDKKFNSELKEAIINSAREIAINDIKKEKK